MAPERTQNYQDCINAICGGYGKDIPASHLADNLIAQFVSDYSDKYSFILELIQNAVDSAPPGSRVSVRFQLRNDDDQWTLVVSNNGNPFDIGDIERLCGVCQERKGPEKIGYKGLGFKTVTLVTDNPRIFSSQCHFQFDKAVHKEYENLWIAIPHWMDSDQKPAYLPPTEQWVSFVLPIRKDVDMQELSNVLDGLATRSASLLLFLRDLAELQVDNKYSDKSFAVKWQITTDPFLHEIVRRQHHGEEESIGNWVITHFPAAPNDGMRPIPPEAIADYKQKRGYIPKDMTDSTSARPIISLAFRVLRQGDRIRFDGSPNRRGTVCALFPLRLQPPGSGLRFTVHADFFTTQNREHLVPGSPWNQWIIGNLPSALVSATREFKRHPELHLLRRLAPLLS